MAAILLALAASGLCLGPRALPRASSVLRRAAGPRCAGTSAGWPGQVTLTPEQVAILLQRIQLLEARVVQLETGSNALPAGRLRLGSRVASHFSATAARLSGSAPLPGLRARLVWGAAVGPANVSGALAPAAELRTPITFRSEFLRLLGSFDRDAGAADAVARTASSADPATLAPDADALFFSQLSATTAAAIDSAAQSAKASVDFALDKAVSDVDRVLTDASRLASSVIAPPARLPAGPPPTGRVTRARLDSILQKRDALLRRRERLLQQPREVVARTLGAVNATLGALNSTLALAEKQLACRRLLGASFALGTGGGLVLHFAVSGFGGGVAAAPVAALRALLGGCVAAYSSTLANRLGALARLMAAIALTLWDQLLEKRRQAEFVYHTGRLFEKMDTQMQAWQLEKWAGASSSAIEGASGFVNEWYANTSASLGAAVSSGWNSTVSTAASTAGALAPVGASVASTWAKVDNATGMSQGVAIAAQGFDAIKGGFAGAGEAVAQLQREWFASSGGGKEGEPTGGVNVSAIAAQTGDGGLDGAAGQGEGPPGPQITPVEQEQPAPQGQEARRAPDGIASAFAYARLPLESLLFFRPPGGGFTQRW